MNSFYWTWINLRIEISQLLLSDDLSLPEDVLSIKKKKTALKETKMCAAPIEMSGMRGGRAQFVRAGNWAPGYENINA